MPPASPSRRGRNRTFDRRLIRTLLQPLSYTPQIKVRSERFELSPAWVKARDASATPQPQTVMTLRFKRSGEYISCSPVKFCFPRASSLQTSASQVVALRIRTKLLQPVPAARVGFEPDLSGLKNQRPHQKSNEPIVSVSAYPYRSYVFVFHWHSASELRLSFALTKAPGTKKPGVTRGHTGSSTIVRR